MSASGASDKLRGCITRQYTVWCHTEIDGKSCACWMQIDCKDMKLACEAFRRQGWRASIEHGWQCPGCLDRSKDPHWQKHRHCG